MVKNPPANAEDVRDMSSIPVSGRYPEEGNGNPLQYFARRIPRTEEPGGSWGHKGSDTTEQLTLIPIAQLNLPFLR